MPLKPWCLILAAVPLLAACVNDSASYQSANGDVSLSLVRQQRWLWDKTVEAAVIVSRLPDCQRRHKLGNISPAEKIELWQPGPGTFVIRRYNGSVLTETQTCEGWQPQAEDPAGGLGQQLGTFLAEGGKLRFLAAK